MPAKDLIKNWLRVLLLSLLPAIGLGLLALTVGLSFPPYHDEKYYLPISVAFSRHLTYELFLRFNGIPNALGPVFFLIYGAWIRLTGIPELWNCRRLSIIFAALFSAVMIRLGMFLDIKRVLLFALAILALPLFLTTSITFLSEPVSSLASTLGVFLWLLGLQSGQSRWYWAAVLPLAIAVNIRQPNLAIPLALMVSGAFIARKKSAVVAPLIAILLEVPFWIAWGGFFPPAQISGALEEVKTAGAGLHLHSLVHLTTVLGFTFWPALVCRWERKRWLFFVAMVILYLVSPPSLAPQYAGPLQKLGRLENGLFRPLLAVCWAFGVMLVYHSVRQALDPKLPPTFRTLFLVGLAELGIYVASPQAFERYSLTFSPFWLLALLPKLESSRKIWPFWIVALLIASLLNVWVVLRGIPLGT